MPGSRRNENPSTYFVQDRKDKRELTRLTIQDNMFTVVMGGVLSEQADPTVFHRMFDVGCGAGGWLINAAQTYPEMSLVGIDISQRMIKYARSQAEAHQVNDRVEFHVMDVLDGLEFPTASFDLVNLRSGVSFLRTWDWTKLLGELLRVTRPGGVIRITEGEVVSQSNSSALMRLCEMLQDAFYQAGHLFTRESTGLTAHLTQLLDRCGCERVQTKAHAMEYHAGTPEGETYCEDMMLAFQTLRPFIQKWGSVGRDYDTIYRQAMVEMRQPDFITTFKMLTVWGSKPEPKLKELQQ